jgi:hypothetical protein
VVLIGITEKKGKTIRHSGWWNCSSALTRSASGSSLLPCRAASASQTAELLRLVDRLEALSGVTPEHADPFVR